MFTGSPFSNSPRPSTSTSSRTSTPFNPATTHPASIFPFTIPHHKSKVTAPTPNVCDKEQTWASQWNTLKHTWHPAALSQVKPGPQHPPGNANANAMGTQSQSNGGNPRVEGKLGMKRKVGVRGSKL